MASDIQSQLKLKIEFQRNSNIELFKTIPLATHEDPLNKKAEPILEKWRAGSVKLKSMIAELQQLELASKTSITEPSNKAFVNSFGEATNRDITCSAYKSAENRTKKAILSFIS
jgi:hypothetical protein